MSAEYDRLGGIEGDLREVRVDMGEVRKEIVKISVSTAALQNTVDLLVAGKIKQGENEPTPQSVVVQAKDSKGSGLRGVAADLARLVGAALAGFLAGRGGS